MRGQVAVEIVFALEAEATGRTGEGSDRRVHHQMAIVVASELERLHRHGR